MDFSDAKGWCHDWHVWSQVCLWDLFDLSTIAEAQNQNERWVKENIPRATVKTSKDQSGKKKWFWTCMKHSKTIGSPPKNFSFQVHPKLWLCMIGAVLLRVSKKEVAETIFFWGFLANLAHQNDNRNDNLTRSYLSKKCPSQEEVYVDKWAL